MHREIEEERTGGGKEILERRIAAADREIDSIVYDLYGLTEEEIALVEGEG